MEATIKKVSKLDTKIYCIELDDCKIIVLFGAINTGVYNLKYTNPAVKVDADNQQIITQQNAFAIDSVNTNTFGSEQLSQAATESQKNDIPTILWAIFVEIVRRTQKPIP